MATETISNGSVAVAESAATLANEATVTKAPADKRRKRQHQTGAPDYANMGAADLLGAFWGFVRNPLADTAALLVNTTGATAPDVVRGELAALVSVALGLRKAYGRGIKVADVRKDLSGVTVPDGFNPTFALYLSAAKLRPDDASERKVAADVRSAIRAKIRTVRKG